MTEEHAKLTGLDFGQGVKCAMIPERSMLSGHANGEQIVLVRSYDSFFALGATCPHYGAPLADGLLVEETIRCPWHHACFSLRTGAALRAPALDPLSRWRV